MINSTYLLEFWNKVISRDRTGLEEMQRMGRMIRPGQSDSAIFYVMGALLIESTYNPKSITTIFEEMLYLNHKSKVEGYIIQPRQLKYYRVEDDIIKKSQQLSQYIDNYFNNKQVTNTPLTKKQAPLWNRLFKK